MSSPVGVIQLLILFEEASVRELGPTLWAALLEVERFYNHGEPRATFERHFSSRYQLNLSAFASTKQVIGRILGSDTTDHALTLLSRERRHEYSAEGEQRVKGRYTGTIDQHKLASVARELLADAAKGKSLLIVTDREITPPPNYRYLVGDGGDDYAVVSTAPTDPTFWRQQDSARLVTIKHRVRTACLGFVGEFVGLDQCDNPFCFLYSDVDSVTTLDTMGELGPEHEIDGLTGCGFQLDLSQAEAVQRVVSHPKLEGQLE